MTGSRLETYVRERLAGNRGILLMTHLVVGYPSLEANRRMLEIMADADVDLVELQMPFSEPIADGPIFVRANQAALESGITVDEYFEFFDDARSICAFPRLMMGYYNPVFCLGHKLFCRRLADAGGMGFILPDLPHEEYDGLFELADDNCLAPILLMTPTNSTEHLRAIGGNARGFVYAVARKGVTGCRTEMEEQLFRFIDACRHATGLPLALGFGLRSGDDLTALRERVDIGIVGSALLEVWEQGGESAYTGLLTELAAARG
ncbi:MAG: tryptophan synthase subunit alpha [Candidatus Latescibacterota bacterium]|nr:tryptophan synthase subunit alpha [Candidatus Latescibacterota bacterium]